MKPVLVFIAKSLYVYTVNRVIFRLHALQSLSPSRRQAIIKGARNQYVSCADAVK